MPLLTLADAELAFGLHPLLDRANLSVRSGERIGLIGRNGTGKSTLLRVIAGQLALDGGELRRRDGLRIGVVEQEPSLPPAATLRESLVMRGGLECIADERARWQAESRLVEFLHRFGLDEQLQPGVASGGECKRATLALALALEPQLLLLDEPLSALDVETRHAVRGELRQLLATLSCVTVFVTHSPLEALVFGDRIVVLERGRVAQLGDRAALLRQPRTRYVATLLGLNLLPGRVTARNPGGTVTLETARGTVTVAEASPGDELFVAVSPEHVLLSVDPPDTSARNVFAGTITELVPEPPFGDRVRVVLGPEPPFVAEVTAAAAHQLELAVGMRVHAVFKATSVTAYA
jgi:molybdopterin-binding protein